MIDLLLSIQRTLHCLHLYHFTDVQYLSSLLPAPFTFSSLHTVIKSASFFGLTALLKNSFSLYPPEVSKLFP